MHFYWVPCTFLGIFIPITNMQLSAIRKKTWALLLIRIVFYYFLRLLHCLNFYTLNFIFFDKQSMVIKLNVIGTKIVHMFYMHGAKVVQKCLNGLLYTMTTNSFQWLKHLPLKEDNFCSYIVDWIKTNEL